MSEGRSRTRYFFKAPMILNTSASLVVENTCSIYAHKRVSEIRPIYRECVILSPVCLTAHTRPEISTQVIKCRMCGPLAAPRSYPHLDRHPGPPRSTLKRTLQDRSRLPGPGERVEGRHSCHRCRVWSVRDSGADVLLGRVQPFHAGAQGEQSY